MENRPVGRRIAHGLFLKLDPASTDCVLAFGNWLLRWPGHRLRIAVLRKVLRIEVDASCTIQRHVRLMALGGVVIGPGSIVNQGSLLDGRAGLHIGAQVNISPEAMLLSADHDPDSPDFAARFTPTYIGDRSWISTRAVVLPGTTIGEGCVVGAGSVVRGEIPAWTLVAGVPARVVRDRSSDAQQSLNPYRRWLQ